MKERVDLIFFALFCALWGALTFAIILGAKSEKAKPEKTNLVEVQEYPEHSATCFIYKDSISCVNSFTINGGKLK